MLIPVIISGGAGTRLWPFSRKQFPKPFGKFGNKKSLILSTCERAASINGVEQLLIVTNKDYFFLTRDELQPICSERSLGVDYILEPLARNTAPAIAAAAMRIKEAGLDATMLVLAADHLISDSDAFESAVQQTRLLAQEGYLVTFGIAPDRPETGYGYIEAGKSISVADNGFEVSRFVEKPDADTAEGYLKQGNFFWNSGMFCFKPEVYLAALEKYSPALFETFMRCWQNSNQSQIPFELDKETFSDVISDSIDYAVMEKAEKVAVVKAGFDWSDIGAWDAVADLSENDENGNSVGENALFIDSTNSCVTGSERLIAMVGVNNLVIADTPDALLVADRSKAQKVKEVVAILKSKKDDRAVFHKTVHRPWGTFTTLNEGAGFKVKRIQVKPGASLSLQLHHHRNEHWVVVRGQARVVNGDKEILMQANESTYIPVGTRHRLTNEGESVLELIEVQCGDYLGEDDIVRFDDIYGRA